MDRQGNSLDRALLLSALLEKAGHTVRLAHRQLDREQAVRLLPDLIRCGTVSPRNSEAQPEPELGTVAAHYQLDGTAVQRTLETQANRAEKTFRDLHDRVRSQTARLLKSVTAPNPDADWTSRYEQAVEALRDHWWVQQTNGSSWADLDPLLSSDASPDRVVAAADLPRELHHELTVRVVVERASHGLLQDSVVLAHTLRPSDLQGVPIALQFWPTSWPKELHSDPGSKFGLRAQALEQRRWVAGLILGGKVVAQADISAAGANRPEAGGPFGGLGGAIGGAVRPEQSASADDLTAAWIEYEIRAPGRVPRVVRRAVFDLVGPSRRAHPAGAPLELDGGKRLARSLALMMRVEMLPITSRIAPEFVLHLNAQSLLANRRVLQALAMSGPSGSSPDLDSLLSRAAPPVSPLYSLALARLAWSRFSDRLYVDQVGLITRHRHAGPSRTGIIVRGAVEIVAKDLGISLSERDAFAVRLEQGVLDSNAEALWWLGEGLNNTSEAFNSSSDWVTLTAAKAAGVDRVSVTPEARDRIRDDLAGGLIVVAPVRPIERGPDQYVGWWRIDPATGVTTGTAGNGWAQCGSEYSVHLAVLAEYANAWAFEYAFCHGLIQGMNAFKYLVGELRARGFALYGGEIKVQDPMRLLASSDRGCVLGAFLAASISIMPYLFIQTERWAEFGLIAPRLKTIEPYRGPRGTIISNEPLTPSRPGGAPPGEGAPPSSGPRSNPEPGVGEGAGQPSSGGRPPAAEPPADPMGKTQPNPSNTQNDLGARPSEPPPPSNPIPRSDQIAAAKDALWATDQESKQAFRDLIEYREKYPPGDGYNGWEHPHPQWDAKRDAELVKRMWDTQLDKEAAGRNLRALERQSQDAAAAARRRPGQGGLQLGPAPRQPAGNLPGCPPNCGNANPTGLAEAVNVPAPSSADQIAVGSSGVASSIEP